jgi:hypothetical protein
MTNDAGLMVSARAPVRSLPRMLAGVGLELGVNNADRANIAQTQMLRHL